MQFKVMSHRGDDRQQFDVANAEAVDQAMARFAELVGKGHVAVEPGPDGHGGKTLKALDPKRFPETVVFYPQLIGG